MEEDIKYEMVVYWSDEDEAYVVEVPELPGCMADGRTYEDAIIVKNIIYLTYMPNTWHEFALIQTQ